MESLFALNLFASNASVGHLLALVLLSLVVGYLAQLLLRLIVYGIPQFLEGLPLSVVEREYPGSRLTWLTKGVLLTSRATGKTVAEIPLADVLAALTRRPGLLSYACVRFCSRLRISR